MGGKSSVEMPLEPDFHTDTSDTEALEKESTPDDCADEDFSDEKSEEKKLSARKSDLAKALDRDLSRLDNMIEKAENAQYSMSHQRKEMNKFLN
ncbi:hypothetical protein JTB14_036025 [Gonioctena quinquepunctata]|nr:hypothetical protein JTB14_036025 [Gonioctena quinquepunctata]